MKSLKELFRIGKGPSSSHTMGPQKAAQMFIEKYPNAKSFEVTLYETVQKNGLYIALAVVLCLKERPMKTHLTPKTPTL